LGEIKGVPDVALRILVVVRSSKSKYLFVISLISGPFTGCKGKPNVAQG